MDGPGINIFGFRVRADASWFILVVLVTWSLSTSFFPDRFMDLSNQEYWFMGIVTAFGLFASVIGHELTHSIVARRLGVSMRGITLFLFGGVAESGEEAPNPRTEFWIAIAGPIFSFVLGFTFFLAQAPLDPGLAKGICSALGVLNWMLALFNMVPAYPLDGGRILKAAIWKWKGNPKVATRIASGFGQGFGIFMVVVGIMGMFAGNILAGGWWVLLGLFLRQMAKISFEQFMLVETLRKEKVGDIMSPLIAKTHPDATVDDFVHTEVYKHPQNIFPVVEQDHVVGCVMLEDIKKLTPTERKNHHVGDIMQPYPITRILGTDTSAVAAFNLMAHSGKDAPLVVEDEAHHVVGSISLYDIVKHYAVRRELDEAG